MINNDKVSFTQEKVVEVKKPLQARRVLPGNSPDSLTNNTIAPSEIFREKSSTLNQTPVQDSSSKVMMATAIGALVFLLSLAGGYLGTRLGDGNSNSSIIQSSLNGEDRIVTEESQLISNVAKRLDNSVVSITVEESVTGLFGQQSVSEGAGTGVVVNSDGLILTNKHVVPEGVSNISVVLSDGTVYENVDVIGRDPFNDVAFIQVTEDNRLEPATLGNSDTVVVGESVIAIGNALGRFDNTVTTGIISGLSRPIIAGDIDSSSSLEGLFQTDASINPGNSGGPLLNLNGEVIGINTAIANDAENIGFAIPINDITGILESVVENGRIVRPYLGVRYISLTTGISEELGLSRNEGAYIQPQPDGSSILDGSPASKAGIADGDIIIEINDNDITPERSLVSLVSRYQVGETIVLTVLNSEGSSREVQVVLEAVPDSL